jgi:hypothetical protein
VKYYICYEDNLTIPKGRRSKEALKGRIIGCIDARGDIAIIVHKL